MSTHVPGFQSFFILDFVQRSPTNEIIAKIYSFGFCPNNAYLNIFEACLLVLRNRLLEV